jgi:biotin carboxyl carrier protein
MSGTPGQDAIEQTKRQLRSIMGEISTLSRSNTAEDEYFPQLLQRLVSALAAVGGAIWLPDRDQQPKLKYQQNVSQSLLEEQADDSIQHARLVKRLFANAQPQLIPPLTRRGEEGAEEGNPTRYLLVTAPLLVEQRVEGLIEIFQRSDSTPETQTGYLRFLVEMAKAAEEWLRASKLRAFSDRQQLWQQADTFARAVHETLDLRQCAYVLANEGRRLIGCDRVSVALLKGRKCKVEAISGQDSIESRSNVAKALNELATRVVAADEPLWYDGQTEDLPPQLEEAIESYVDQSYGRTITILPLREVKPDGGQASGATGEIDRDDAYRGDSIGALIVEQIESNIPADILRQRIGLVYEHGTRALANARQHNNLFLMPVWRTLGKASWLLRARTLPKTLAALGALAAVVLGLIFIPMDMQLEATGSLRPDVERNVYAPQENCQVIEVLVDHDSAVDVGATLVRLRNLDLEKQLEEVQGKIEESNAEDRGLSVQLSRANDSTDLERQELQNKKRAAQLRLESLKLQLETLNEKSKQLTVVSPIRGKVVTWDVEKTLRGRFVTTGEVLMTISDPDSGWHLELMMPEQRMTHFDRGVNDLGKDLKVEYILASNTQKKLTGTVKRWEARTQMDQDEGHSVKLYVIPDELPQDVQLRPGARVIGDVSVGKRSSGYALFYPVYEKIYEWLF